MGVAACARMAARVTTIHGSPDNADADIENFRQNVADGARYDVAVFET